MTPTPTFQTEQITLRPFTKEDAPELLAYLNHPDLIGRSYIPWDFSQDLPLTLSQAEKIIEQWSEKEAGFCYAVVLNQSRQLIGHAEVSQSWDPHMSNCAVTIAPPFQRQGYGGQALTLLLDYLYDFTVAHNVSHWIADWNTPAQAFVQKYGFQQAGIIRRNSFRGGKYSDAIYFDLLRPEWKERSHAA
jgi:ribosomal-protein-alanine N-acetyltransferase